MDDGSRLPIRSRPPTSLGAAACFCWSFRPAAGCAGRWEPLRDAVAGLPSADVADYTAPRPAISDRSALAGAIRAVTTALVANVFDPAQAARGRTWLGVLAGQGRPRRRS